MESQQHPPASQARPTVFQIEAASATHIGRRNTNADAALLDNVAGFYAVADGIGDTPRSFLVAQMALEGVRELFLTPWASSPRTRRTVVELGSGSCSAWSRRTDGSTRRGPRARRGSAQRSQGSSSAAISSAWATWATAACTPPGQQGLAGATHRGPHVGRRGAPSGYAPR